MIVEHDKYGKTGNEQGGYGEILSRIDQCSREEGIVLIEDFLRQIPDHAQAHNDLAVLFYGQGNKLQTLGHYEKAVRLSPENDLFKKNLASFYFVEMGWTDDAIGIYTNILRRNPADTETLTALGIISNAIGRTDEAKIFFRKLLELEPWNNEARKALESIFIAGCDKNLTDSLETDPPSKPQQNSGIEAIMAGLRKTVTKLENSSAEEMRALSGDVAPKETIDKSIYELEKLLEKNPHDALAHNDLGVLHYRQGNIAKSIDHHEFAVANNPRNPLFLKNLANVYYTDAGKTDEAINIYTGLLQEYPEDTEILSALAIISMNNNRPEEARIFLKKILEIEPYNNDAFSLLESLEPRDEKGFFLTKR